MQDSTKYPILDIGSSPCKAVVIPIIFAMISLKTRDTRWNVPQHITLQIRLTRLLLVLHSVLYFWNIVKLLRNPNQDYDLCLLEYVLLVWGETALESDFWLFMSTALGWIIQSATPSMDKSLLSLLLSIPCAWEPNGRTSMGATISGLSLMTGTIASLPHALGGTPGGATPLRILALSIFVALGSVLARRVWPSDTIARMPRLGPAVALPCVRCAQDALCALALHGAGWISSAYLWSCFPWRWLLTSRPSTSPSCTMFSFAGGSGFSLVLLLWKFSRTERAPAVDDITFRRMQFEDCSSALRWTNFMYISLWLLCEAFRLQPSMRA